MIWCHAQTSRAMYIWSTLNPHLWIDSVVCDNMECDAHIHMSLISTDKSFHFDILNPSLGSPGVQFLRVDLVIDAIDVYLLYDVDHDIVHEFAHPLKTCFFCNSPSVVYSFHRNFSLLSSRGHWMWWWKCTIKFGLLATSSSAICASITVSLIQLKRSM